jgi:two-component system response regulator RegX3
MHILVVEDDPSIAEPLVAGLRREGFEVTHAPTGGSALEAGEVDLVLLDLGLPDIDGREVCRRLRATSSIPIIVVTAAGDELDRVMLLEWGADDYVVKPFGFRELVARVRAVLRRAGGGGGPTGTTRTVGPLTVDTRTRRVTFDDADVALTPKEFDLLAFLLEDPGAVVTREEIIRSIWDENWWGPTKTLDVHIASLRKKLAPGLIETVRGVGFRVVEPPA